MLSLLCSTGLVLLRSYRLVLEGFYFHDTYMHANTGACTTPTVPKCTLSAKEIID